MAEKTGVTLNPANREAVVDAMLQICSLTTTISHLLDEEEDDYKSALRPLLERISDLAGDNCTLAIVHPENFAHEEQDPLWVVYGDKLKA